MPPELTTLTARFLFYMQGSIASDLARYLIGAGGVTLVLWLGRRALAHRRIQTRRPARGDIVREVRQSLRTIVVFAVVDLITTVVLARGGLIPVGLGAIAPALLIAQVVALALLHDTWFYWMHRALHRPKLFRLTHLAHHRSRTPTSWAAYSFATGEAVTEALAVPAILLIVSHVTPICPQGVYPLAVIVFLGHQIARNVIGHSGHELAWSGFTRSRWTGWLTTTTHHDLHHSEGRYNYGLYFTWWDRWMGTEHPRYHDRFEAVATRAPEQAGGIEQGLTPSSG